MEAIGILIIRVVDYATQLVFVG